VSSFILHMAKLPNYLRAHRKRLGLSQTDVAYLLGAESGAKVCRYERFNRLPGLETILAYCAIFGRTPSELFAGLHDRIEYEIARRAETLLEKARKEKATSENLRKQKTLTQLVEYKSRRSGKLK
jgi:transcriptional regulator with XRE-family HTH domain